MGDGVAARRRKPGLTIILALCLAGCAGGYQGHVAPGTSTAPASNYSNAAATSTTSVPPGDLTGLEASTVRQLFGTPGLVRKDSPAEVWQYRSPSCVLDIYLYPDGDKLTVAHAEARAPKANGDPLLACIAKFAQARQKTVG
jgi:hypothetical protein